MDEIKSSLLRSHDAHLELPRNGRHVRRRGERIKHPSLVLESDVWQIGDVHALRVEHDGVRFVQQQSVGGRLAIGPLAAGALERPRAEPEVKGGAPVVLGPKQNDLRFSLLIESPLSQR